MASPGQQAVTVEAPPETEKMKKGAVVLVMPTHVVVVCSVVGFLGLLVVVLGVAGEAATSQALVQNPVETDYFITDSNKCVYQTTPALACGIVAALLALTAQVAVTAISFFRGCCPTWELPKETRRIVGVALSASSWILVIIVVSLFITGAAMNSDDKKRDRSTDGDCPVDPGSAMFAAATVLSLVATGLQIASYVLLATQEGSTKPQPAEVAMGQPIVQHQAPRNDAEEEIAGGDPPLPPSAPPLSEAAENNSTSQV